MNGKIGMRAFSVLFAVLLMSIAMVPVVSASNGRYAGPTDIDEGPILIVGVDVPAPEPIPLEILLKAESMEMEHDDRVIIQDTVSYLSSWNEELKWGLSEEEVKKYSQILEEQVLVNYYDVDNRYYLIPNLDKFGEELGLVLGLNADEVDRYVRAHREQIARIIQDGHLGIAGASALDSRIDSSTGSSLYVSPSSQSAPHATGKAYYLYIFVDFTTPVSGFQGTWIQSNRNAALSGLNSATTAIRNQAPAAANLVNDGGFLTVTVSGQNQGDQSSSWGPNGWMVTAARNLGYSGTGYAATEQMARSIKSWAGADQVVIIYLTHDNQGCYATGTSTGYADMAVISYWYPGLPNTPLTQTPSGVYAHEVYHLYGALDEYSGSSFCGQYSDLAVSPMHDKYTNQHHEDCSPLNVFIMRNSVLNVGPSPSTKNFIGWGDWNGNGILDPFK